MKYLALTLVALASCGLDLARREGSLSVIPLGTPVPDGTTVVISLDSDGNKANANGAASAEVTIPSVPAGPARVRVSVPSMDLASNGPAVLVLETEVATVGVVFFPAERAKDDDDGDGIINADDNCPEVANPDQADGDRDGVGDACDNCPANGYPSQANEDGDAFGDLCDPDIDGDGVLNVQDACPRDPRGSVDPDGDGVCDPTDNCPTVPNPDQADCDGDGIGDACDPDIDGDGIPNSTDACPFAVGPSCPDPTACHPEAL